MAVRVKTVAFYGTVSAGLTKVLVSPRISRSFILKKIRAKFAPGQNNLVKLRFYSSADADSPTTGAPGGFSLLMEYGQVDYVVGDDDAKELINEIEVLESGSYLKVYAVNSDAYDHNVDVQMTIENQD